MKENEHIEDELLGRWLSGDISPEEKKKLEASDTFQTYQLISQYAETLETSDYDEQKAYQELQQKLSKHETKIIQLNRRKWIGIAAGFAVLIGIGGFLFSRMGTESNGFMQVVTAQQETQMITLPSNSEVTLNVASSLEYNEDAWETERKLKLNGEAYFKVTKGKKFSVETKSGTIEVLGTQFNICDRKDVVEVMCYEGKVKVSDNSDQFIILTKGQAARINNGKIQQWSPEFEEKPVWQTGGSSFHDAEFDRVIEELENQFAIRVEHNQDFSQRRYTGFFEHKNLQMAAEVVFLPMGLSYTIQGDSVIVVK